MKCIVPHDPLWAGQYGIAAGEITGLLGPACVRIHHIGSTSIADIVAKPIIDILLETPDLEKLDEQAGKLVAAGFEARGEYGITGRRYFTKEAQSHRPAVHLHCFEMDTHEVGKHLAFRDYLRFHPDIAAQYGQIKLELSDADGVLVPDYQDRKHPFVDRVTKEALAWHAKQSTRFNPRSNGRPG